MADAPTPVIFIHGLWLHPLSWTAWAGMFGAAGYRQWAIPPPGRPLFEAAAANFAPHSPATVNTTLDNRGPLLLITGGQDHTVPEAITTSTLKQYRHSHATNDLIEFPDRGHSLTIDHGWRDIAQACLDWLYKNSLDP